MIICSCENVKDKEITHLISQGCVNASEIKKILRAGGDCGGCMPQITKMIEETSSSSEEDNPLK